MNDIDPQPLSGIAYSFGARMSADPVRIAVLYQGREALTAAFSAAAQQVAARYQDFTVRALSMGLTIGQVDAILKSEALLEQVSSRFGGADARLDHYAEHGYLPVLLGEVLTLDELIDSDFLFETVLNGGMDRAYAKHFAELKRDKQRGLTRAGIELALQTEWPLERAMAAVMPYVEGA